MNLRNHALADYYMLWIQLMLSVEVAYSNGDLKLLIHRHDIGLTLVDYTQESSAEIMWVLPEYPIIIIIWFGGSFRYQQK